MFEFVPIVIGIRSFENQGVRRLTDDCFQNKNNEEIGYYGQTLNSNG